MLLLKLIEGIPDASKIPELPALFLPGHNNNRKRILSSSISNRSKDGIKLGDGYPDDGIDYDLLAKDRSQCTPAELDMIRRERNRMHAKRTRDRKKRFMDEMERIIKQLREENALLEEHLLKLSEKYSGTSGEATPSLSSPKLEPYPGHISSLVSLNGEESKSEKSGTTATSEITSTQDCIDSHSKLPPKKRKKIQCFNDSFESNVPTSITTTKISNTTTTLGT